jgi:hypothetical protein
MDYYEVDNLTVDQSSPFLNQVHEMVRDVGSEFIAATNPTLNLAVSRLRTDVISQCESIVSLYRLWRSATDAREGQSVLVDEPEEHGESRWRQLDSAAFLRRSEPYREAVISSVFMHPPVEGDVLMVHNRLADALDQLRIALRAVTSGPSGITQRPRRSEL